MPELSTVHLRSDNAAAYHCEATISAMPHLSKIHHIHVKSYHFSEPQAGKGPCDRAAAHIKSHLNQYINRGNNVTTAREFVVGARMVGSESQYGNVFVCGRIQQNYKVEGFRYKIPQITMLFDFVYPTRNLFETKVWRAYQVGYGKSIRLQKVIATSLFIDESPPGSDVHSYGRFRELGKRRTASYAVAEAVDIEPLENAAGEFDDTSASAITIDSQGILGFKCPIDGCVSEFLNYYRMSKHLAAESHRFVVERETTLDAARQEYVSRLQAVTLASDITISSTSVKRTGEPLDVGWALKKATERMRFSASQKQYLNELFKRGEINKSNKISPQQASAMMRTARQKNGNPLFNREEYLTRTQISGFFARLSAQKYFSDNYTFVTNPDDIDKQQCAKDKASASLKKRQNKAIASAKKALDEAGIKHR
jgi:hypothetical protein